MTQQLATRRDNLQFDNPSNDNCAARILLFPPEGFPATGLLSTAELTELADLFGWSERQLQVAEGIVADSTAKQLAGKLGITERTVREHQARLFAKCGVGSPVEFLKHLLEIVLKLRAII